MTTFTLICWAFPLKNLMGQYFYSCFSIISSPSWRHLRIGEVCTETETDFIRSDLSLSRGGDIFESIKKKSPRVLHREIILPSRNLLWSSTPVGKKTKKPPDKSQVMSTHYLCGLKPSVRKMWKYPICTKTTVFLASLFAVGSHGGNVCFPGYCKKVYMLLNEAMLPRSTWTQILWWKHSVNVNVLRQTGLPSLSGNMDDTTQAGRRHFILAVCCFVLRSSTCFDLYWAQIRETPQYSCGLQNVGIRMR